MSWNLKYSCAVAGIAAGLCTGSNALAADLGPYIGVGAGIYTLSLDEDEFDDFDDNAAFGRVFGGLRVTSYLAVEADYQKLAETSEELSGLDLELDATAFSVSLRPILPITEFINLYGRVGWTWYDIEAEASGFGSSIGVSDSDDAFTWGGGVDFNLGQSLSLRADLTRIEISDTDLNLVSAGVFFRF